MKLLSQFISTNPHQRQNKAELLFKNANSMLNITDLKQKCSHTVLTTKSPGLYNTIIPCVVLNFWSWPKSGLNLIETGKQSCIVGIVKMLLVSFIANVNGYAFKSCIFKLLHFGATSSIFQLAKVHRCQHAWLKTKTMQCKRKHELVHLDTAVVFGRLLTLKSKIRFLKQSHSESHL